jgi:hypothetical protein
VADRFAEIGLHDAAFVQGAHGEQGDFVIEIDDAFDDDPPGLDPAAAGRVIPGSLDIGRAAQQRLAFAGGGHYRFDDAWVANAVINCRLQFGQGVGEAVGRGRHAQFFGSQPADAFAVHREFGGAGGWDHFGQAGGFDLDQHVGGNRFDFRHDQIRLFQFDQFP